MMRCEDVTRELAAPSGEITQSAVPDHLAVCGECAKWARRNATLDRVWDLTRPAAPSAEAWDSIWANALAAVEETPAAEVSPAVLPFRRGMVWIFAAVQVAAAAALLVCVSPSGWKAELSGPAVAQRPAPQVAPEETQIASTAAAAFDSIEVDQGVVLAIRFDTRGRKSTTELPDASLEAYNDLEGIAGEGNVVQ